MPTNERYQLAASNFNKLQTAQGRLMKVLSEVAGAGLPFEVSAGLVDGIQGLAQQLGEVVANCDVKGEKTSKSADTVPEDPRTPEEIKRDQELADEHGIGAII